MSRRKAFEELAYTRTLRRVRSIRKQIEQIGYDWFDSEIHVVSNEAEDLRDALDQFEEQLQEAFRDWKETAE